MTASRANPRAQLARGTIWTMAGTGGHLAAGVIASVAAARILGPLRFGELAITRTTLFTIMLLAGASIGVATSRAVASMAGSDPERAGRVIGLLFNAVLATSIVATLICIVLAAPIARLVGAPQLATVLAVSAPYIIFTSLSAVQTGALTGLHAFEAAGSMLAFEGVLTGALLISAAYAGGIIGAVAAMVAASAIAFLARGRILAAVGRRHGVVVRHRGVAAELPLIRTLVIPSVLFGLGAQPFAWFARMMLAHGDHGLVEIGIFSAAYSWGASVLTIPAQVTRPAMPILTSLFAKGATADFRRLLRDTLLFVFGTATLVALPIMLLAPWIMRAYGKQFESGALVLVVVAASSLLASLSGALRSALVAVGKVWGQAMQSLLWGVTLVVAFTLLRVHGAIGLAAAYAIAFAASLAAQAVLTVFAATDGPGMRSDITVSDADVVADGITSGAEV